MRVESGRHWAELSEEPFLWGEKNRLRQAAAEPLFTSFGPLLVATRVTAWSYASDPGDLASWDTVDAAFGDVVLRAALDQWKAEPDPNDSSAPSAP